jgi:two-component system sensor histidine kinase EvgS
MLVQYLGGEPIQLSSQEGQGSEFSFKLPLHEIPSASSTTDSIMSEQVNVKLPQSMTILHRNPFISSIPPCKSVLVVDDSDFNRIVMCRIIESLGASTAEAMNGKAALEYVNLHKQHSGCIKMIFIDYEMPDLNGCQVSKHISEMGDLNPKPLRILCTAYSDQQTLKRCREAGMTGFIQKPCSISDLKEVLYDNVSGNCMI